MKAERLQNEAALSTGHSPSQENVDPLEEDSPSHTDSSPSYTAPTPTYSAPSEVAAPTPEPPRPPVTAVDTLQAADQHKAKMSDGSVIQSRTPPSLDSLIQPALVDTLAPAYQVPELRPIPPTPPRQEVVIPDTSFDFINLNIGTPSNGALPKGIFRASPPQNK